MIQTEEKQTVIKAIDQLGRRVTAADVATKTGLPILKVTEALNKVAEETEGHLEVATTGDIAYSFSAGYQNAYLLKGLQKTLHDVGAFLFTAGYFLLRISFGIMLVLSFIIVVVLIIAAMIAMSQGRDDRDSGDSGFNFNFFDYMVLRELFWWSMPSPYYNVPGYQNYDRPSVRPRDKGNFLASCFSFLFGDGNPNLHLEERKWQCAAQVIKSNNGSVTAEQLAPYTGGKPGDEDSVLPVLVHFNGKPEVTEQGHIIYLFPDMQVTAGSSTRQSFFNIMALPKYLEEFRWQFTNVPADQLIPVYILATVNLFGSLWLLGQSSHIPLLAHLHGLIVALLVYAIFFITVPAVRWFCLNLINGRIDKRNEEKRDSSIKLSHLSPALAEKLDEAKTLRIRQNTVSQNNLAYDSGKDLLDQEFDHPNQIEQDK